MKIKEGRRTSHSYWSRTHGPRRTTHGTSGEHPWWRGDSRRSILPPAGCREEVFWCSRSWKRGGGGTEASSRNRVPLLEFSRDGGINRRKGAARGGPGAPGTPLARPGVGPRRVAAWPPLAPLWPLPGSSGSFMYADFFCIFPEFFLHFLFWGKLK